MDEIYALNANDEAKEGDPRECLDRKILEVSSKRQSIIKNNWDAPV